VDYLTILHQLLKQPRMTMQN
jgi:hypothetical protein